MNDLIIVRLEVEGMRHQIVHAFSKHADGLKEQVDHQVRAAIARFDFEGEVARAADGILRELIRDALKQAFQRLRWDEALTTALVTHMLAELRRNESPEDHP